MESVVLVDEVEDIRGKLQRQFVRKGERLRDAKIGEYRIRFDAGISSEVAVEIAAVHPSAGWGVDVAGKIQKSCRRITRRDRSVAAACGSAAGCDGVRAIREWIEVEVRIGAGKNIKGTAGGYLEDRRDRD